MSDPLARVRVVKLDARAMSTLAELLERARDDAHTDGRHEDAEKFDIAKRAAEERLFTMRVGAKT